MTWNPTVVQPPRDLTILVIDLRESSEFLRRSTHDQVLLFLKQFSRIVDKTLSSICQSRRDEYHIVKFTGDGFLILIDEPLGAGGMRIGPARAVAVARSIRKRVRMLCQRWQLLVKGGADASSVGVVSGVVYGEALFGPVARPAVEMSDAAGEPVVRSFRLAQQRDVQGAEDNDVILTCAVTRSLVRLFNELPASAHAPVRTRTSGVEFHEVALKERTKGTNSASFWIAQWESDNERTDRADPPDIGGAVSAS